MATEGTGTGGGTEGASGGGERNAYCSFCRKSYHDVGPLVEGPDDVYICGECVELSHDIFDQEKARRGSPGDPYAYIRLKLERIARWVEELKTLLDPQSPLFEFWRAGTPDTRSHPDQPGSAPEVKKELNG